MNRVEETIIKNMVQSYLIDTLLDGLVHDEADTYSRFIACVVKKWHEVINDGLLVEVSVTGTERTKRWIQLKLTLVE
jgi:hypothetical protein